MLAFKTSAADIGRQLLLSEVNTYGTRLVMLSLSYIPIWEAMRSENIKGWTFKLLI
jgi:hypothetical protein